MDSNVAIIQAPTPASLLQTAIEKGVDMTQLKELMDLQERWEKKEAKKAFLVALSKFQQSAPVLKRNKTARITTDKGGYSYNYADLGSITQQIKKALKDCGLSYRWEFEEKGELLRVTCIISHKDGHSETSSMESAKDATGGKNLIQQKGSAHTYLERYTLIGALGLSTADEDNDGRSTQAAAKKPDIKKKAPDPAAEDYLDQWKQVLAQVRNKTELQALYLKNRKTVDATPAIQEIFKTRQTQLKAATQTNLP